MKPADAPLSNRAGLCRSTEPPLTLAVVVGERCDAFIGASAYADDAPVGGHHETGTISTRTERKSQKEPLNTKGTRHQSSSFPRLKRPRRISPVEGAAHAHPLKRCLGTNIYAYHRHIEHSSHLLAKRRTARHQSPLCIANNYRRVD